MEAGWRLNGSFMEAKSRQDEGWMNIVWKPYGRWMEAGRRLDGSWMEAGWNLDGGWMDIVGRLYGNWMEADGTVRYGTFWYGPI